MIIPVKGAGQIGLVVDQPHNELPLNAWTHGQNVRFRDGAVEKFFGHIEVFAGMLNSPEWLLSTNRGGLSFWMYAGKTKVGATDGATHADLTRAVGGDYSMGEAIGWTGTIIEDIPVINNGVDIPQQWKYPALATKLVNLEHWPADVRVNSLRGLKRYLIGLDVTKAGQRYPTMIKWSSQAPTGGVPLYWDETNEKVDTGEWVLPGQGGFLVDGVPLRDVLILYKEYETWQMQYVGGTEVFRFNRLFGSVGCLSRRCAIEFFSGKHLVFTGDDVIVHNGQNPESILNERVRGFLQGSIDESAFKKSFVAINYSAFEVWVCFPEIGQEYATKAMVWNWQQNRWGVRELNNISFIETGLVSPQTIGETWEGATGTWDTDMQAWGDRAADPTKQKMLMASPNDSKLLLPEVTNLKNGEPMLSYVERQGLGFPVKVDGPPDYTRTKQILSLWPRVTGTQGGALNVYLGMQEKINGPISWGPAQTFKIGETDFCDFSDSEASRIHAVRFESASDMQWKLHGYDVDVVDRGQF